MGNTVSSVESHPNVFVLGILIRRLSLRILKEQGIEEIFSLVRFDNVIALKLRIRTGEEPEHTVNYYRVRTWNKIFLGPLKDPQLMQWWAKFSTTTAA
jgi:hypothetical protein